MGPLGAFRNELLQEEGGGNRARVDAADVLEVRGVAAEFLGVFLDQRQLPKHLAVRLARLDHGAHPLGVVSHDSGDPGAERAHGGSGQGRDVHDMRGALLSGAGQRIGEHEAALGVGVVHHHGLAVAGAEDVSRPRSRRSRIVLGGRHDSGDRHRHALPGHRRHGGEHRGRAGHVAFHGPHPGGRLERYAAGVEGDALAHESEVIPVLRGGRRAVPEHDEARSPVAPLPDGDQPGIPLLPERLLVPDLDLESGFGRDPMGLAGQGFGSDGFRRLVDEIPGAVHFGSEPHGAGDPVPGRFEGFLGDHDPHPRRCRVAGVLEVPREAVRAEGGAFRHRSREGGTITALEREDHFPVMEVAGVPEGARRQNADSVGHRIVAGGPGVERQRRGAPRPAMPRHRSLDLRVPEDPRGVRQEIVFPSRLRGGEVVIVVEEIRDQRTSPGGGVRRNLNLRCLSPHRRTPP